MISPRKKLFTTLLIPCMAAAFAVSACANNAVPGNTPEPTQLEQNTPAQSGGIPTGEPTNAPTGIPTSEAAPTDVPAPENTELPREHFLEEAYAAASRLGNVYGIKFNKETELMAGSLFVFSDDAGRELTIQLSPNAQGEWCIDYPKCFFTWDKGTNGEFDEWISRLDFADYRDRVITLSAEELAASGGGDPDAAAALFAAKLREMYLNAEPSSPVRCRDVRINRAERSLSAENTYVFSFSVLPEDVFGFLRYRDHLCSINDGLENAELYGYLDFGGSVILTPHEDGSRSGRARLN